MFTTEVSSTTINWAIPMVARIHHRVARAVPDPAELLMRFRFA